MLSGLLFWQLILSSSAVKAAESVESLRYGASLFHFYQNHYFDAMTELMVGQKKNTLGPHASGAELLRGGMSLSYGMDQQAESIFSLELESAPDHIDRSRAWFYLGKVAWQRGEIERALEALSAMDESYDGDLSEESRYLEATALLGKGKSEQALAMLYSLPKDSKWRYYLHYNAGATLAGQGLWAAAETHFERFDDMPLRSPENLALYERAQSAAGYAYLAADKPGEARRSFEKIGLNGAAAENALLGYGWAAVEENDYLGALSAWKPLSSRSMLNPSARESLLAIPYAYEALGRSSVALEQYRAASSIYAQQLEGLNAALKAFETQPVSALLGLSDSPATTHESAAEVSETQGSMSWVYAGDILPESEFAPYLQFLVTRHSFQVALRELRDLYEMRRRMLIAKERLLVLREVDSHQQTVWAQVRSHNTQQALMQRSQVLNDEYRILEATFVEAEASADGRAFAEVKSQARWQRLDRALAAATELEQPEKIARLAFLRGVMQWEDSEALVARQWQARKSLRELKALVDDTKIALAQVNSAIAQRTNQTFLPRINAMDESVVAHLASIEGALGESEQGIRQLAVFALSEQARQMQRALGQSGLATARLYDRAARTLPATDARIGAAQ